MSSQNLSQKEENLVLSEVQLESGSICDINRSIREIMYIMAPMPVACINATSASIEELTFQTQHWVHSLQTDFMLTNNDMCFR